MKIGNERSNECRVTDDDEDGDEDGSDEERRVKWSCKGE